MKVWIVTRDDYSNEGLEGAFDVYEGVAATALDALALVPAERADENGYYRNELDVAAGTVTHIRGYYRGTWINQTFVKDTHATESIDWREVFHIREVEVAGS